MIGHSRLHRRGPSQALVDSPEMVEHEIERQSGSQVSHLLVTSLMGQKSRGFLPQVFSAPCSPEQNRGWPEPQQLIGSESRAAAPRP